MPDPAPDAPPRFSVVIPTYRRNEALTRCLNRLMPGTLRPPPGGYEVIVSDDGPPGDDARRLVERLFPWARWVPGPRRGPAANRNRGAAEARGAWLAFTDDDCLPQPGWLAAYAARLDAPSAAPARVFEGPTTAGGARGYGPFLTAPLNDKGGFLWSCNFVIEKALFDAMGGFDVRFPYPHLEDVDLRMRLEDRREAFPFVPEAVVAHPPRPVAAVGRWAASQESAFYLARKRGVPVREVGPGVMRYLRMWVHTLRECRGAGERVRATAWLGAGYFLVACRWPWWAWKYRMTNDE